VLRPHADPDRCHHLDKCDRNEDPDQPFCRHYRCSRRLSRSRGKLDGSLASIFRSRRHELPSRPNLGPVRPVQDSYAPSSSRESPTRENQARFRTSSYLIAICAARPPKAIVPNQQTQSDLLESSVGRFPGATADLLDRRHLLGNLPKSVTQTSGLTQGRDHTARQLISGGG